MLKNLVVVSMGMISVLPVLAEDNLVSLSSPVDSVVTIQPKQESRFTALDGDGIPIKTINGVPASPAICTRDKVTGLIWEVKTKDSNLRDQKWTYTWYNSTTYTGDENPGHLGSAICGGTLPNNQCNTQTYTTVMNATGLCGANDWRLPTLKELQSLVQANTQSPTIDPTYFPNTQPYAYWTATTEASDPMRAWSIDFNQGIPSPNIKTDAYHVRLVSDGGNALYSLSSDALYGLAAAYKPDLVVTAVTAGSSARAGGKLRVSATVKNQGKARAGASWLAFYLSTNRTITRSDIPTKYGCNIPALRAGYKFNCSGNIVIPSNVKSGAYYLGAYADDHLKVSESNGSNNGRAATNKTIISGGSCTMRILFRIVPWRCFRPFYPDCTLYPVCEVSNDTRFRCCTQ